jgi:class 3 adenylate cyclase
MPVEVKKEIELEIAHVLFIDIIGYSKLSINDQHATVEKLNGIVRASEQFQDAEAASRLLKIPTGDGMALVFYTSPEAPAQCAVEISHALKEHPRLQIRMGIHSGPVSGGSRCKRAGQSHRRWDQPGAAGNGLRRRRAHSPFQACR